MRHLVISYEGTFKGLYEWGHGWKDAETRRKWNEFWENPEKHMKWPSGFWLYAPSGKCNTTGCLASLTGNSIYLHPLRMRGTMFGDCPTKTYLPGRFDTPFESCFEIDMTDFKTICDACAAFCGGTFSLRVSRETEIEVPDLEAAGEVTSSNEDEYLERFAIVLHEKG